jgi:hypothetical protein
MTISLPERQSHWYHRNGTPCHTVPKADGKGVRNVCLRYDRALNLLPSTTNIISVKAKPAIVDYKVKQALMAAVTLPRIQGETEDAFMERVVVDMEQHMRDAAEFGARIHKYCERYHLGDREEDPALEPYVAKYKEWFSENVQEALWAERVLVNEKVGYAGTADLLLLLKDDRKVLADLKTQGIKERVTKTKGTIKNDPAFYPEWEYQLVSYGKCLEPEPDGYVSIVIDSTEPGPCHVYEWPLAGRKNAWRGFLACAFLWCLDRKYWPSGYWN